MTMPTAAGSPAARRRATLLLSWSLAALTASAGGQEWRPGRQTAAGQIYHREAGPAAPDWVRIDTHFDAPPAAVYAVISDYDHFGDFIPYVAESRIVLEADDRQWVYQHLHFPGPVADRVYLFSSTSRGSRPAQHCYRVSWELSDRHFDGIDLSAGILPDAFAGYWELAPGTEPGTTRAEYAIVSDPGGWIPRWLVVKQTDRYVQQIVSAIRKRLSNRTASD